MLEFIILFFVGVISSFINVNAGGGSSLTLPALIFLGLDASVANGTNRIAIIFQNVSAIYSFKKENYYELKNSMILSLLSLPGALAGAIFAIKISNEMFEKVLAVIMILIIVTMILPQKREKDVTESYKVDWKVTISMLAIGFYGGFIQVGVGFLIMALLHNLLKLDLIRVNMHKVFVVFIFTIPTLFVFILSGNVNWHYGLILAVGNILGGWWGAKMSVKKGEKFIKAVLIVAILIMAIKLLDII
ncbi:MAG: sulfite exporter TauE/SafE family protein [Ignavibacterium sp.]|nr:sulfite exporter TauE/SafE family protein [Ignavibacterium sp.]MDW8375457.1 sulfite exporter TauE/SafE family protein [Ignavibacteriales bacterium]